MSRLPLNQPKTTIPNLKLNLRPSPIEGAGTSIAGFLGETQTGPTTPTLVTSWLDYQKLFGGYFAEGKYLPYAVEGFFQNGGQRCYVCRVTDSDFAAALAKLEAVDEVAIVYSPNAQAVQGLVDALIGHCERLRNRFVILDSLKGKDPSSVTKPDESSFAALYYPWVYVKESGTGRLCLVPPGGHVVGIYARVDVEQGVHKAPANQVVKGAVSTEFSGNQSLLEPLNSQGINTIRSFPDRGIRVWGARTLSSDQETKYVNVRRLLIYLEQSITKGTTWATFELNNQATWTKVKTAVENFLTQTWTAGMILGATQQEAFFVKCDRSTMTQNDIDNGRLIVLIGVAPVKPAEFIIFRVAQTIHA